MAIVIIDNVKDIIDRIRTDIQANLPGSNPFLKNGLLSAITIAFGYRFRDMYRLVGEYSNQFFVQTANATYLAFWGDTKGITQGVATSSNGSIVITGVDGTLVDAGTVFTSGAIEFTTDNTGTISTGVQSLATLTRLAGVATATTTTDHGLATGITVTIAGADQTEYNGVHEITVVDNTSFTFAVDASAVTPATGAITAESTKLFTSVTSVTAGSDTNLGAGAALTLQNATVDIDNTAYVSYTGIEGGTDDQTLEEYRSEVLEAWQNPLAHFNEADITRQANTVNGVTRVWVQRITPSVGDVTVYFTRDNDADIFPSGPEVDAVVDTIGEIIPANTDPANVYISGPTPVTVNFVFSTLTPDSTTMRQAVTDSLDDYFRTDTNVGQELTQEQLSAAILNTFDQATGEKLLGFTLSSPVVDISISQSELPKIGTVSF